MQNLITLPCHVDARGSLTVVEKKLPFSIQRVFWIAGMQHGAVRGGHGHIRTHMALVCVTGGCTVEVKRLDEAHKVLKTLHFTLDTPQTLLYLPPYDWHQMYDFLPGTVLVALASEHHNLEDYIHKVQEA